MIVKVSVPMEDLVAFLDALKKQFPNAILEGVYTK